MAQRAGTFKSSPIMAERMVDAKEILSRTYKPERFTLKKKYKVLIYGRLTAWVFDVIPVAQTN